MVLSIESRSKSIIASRRSMIVGHSREHEIA